MSETYYVPKNQITKQIGARLSKGDIETFTFDYTGWGVPTTITWAIVNGGATIANEALASSIATADITVSDTGKSLISVTATDGTKTKVIWITIKAEEPQIIDDYWGWCY